MPDLRQRALRSTLAVLSHPSPAIDRQLLSRNDPDAGLLVVPVSPTVESIGRLAGDILDALGKRNENAPSGRVADLETAWAHDWLHGHRVRRVAFMHTDHLSSAVMRASADLVASVGADPWFIFDRPAPAVAAASLSARPVTIDDGDALQHRLLDMPPAPLVSSAVELLEVRQVGDVPASELRDVVRTARQCIESVVGDGDRISVTAQATHRLPAGWKLVETCAEPGAAAFGQAGRAKTFDWRLFRCFRDTTQVAAAVLAWMGLSVLEMLALRTSNVSEDGATVGVVGQRLSVPPRAAYLLRAARAAALRIAAGSTGPFLHNEGKPLTPYRLRTLVAVAFDEFGHTVVRLDIPFRVNPDERWLRRRGLKVIPDPDYRKPYPLFTRPGRSEPSYTYRTAHNAWHPHGLRRRLSR